MSQIEDLEYREGFGYTATADYLNSNNECIDVQGMHTRPGDICYLTKEGKLQRIVVTKIDKDKKTIWFYFEGSLQELYVSQFSEFHKKAINTSVQPIYLARKET